MRYEGKVSITNRGEKDLDSDPPASVEDDSGGDFFYNLINGQVYSTNDAVWAKWESKKPPSYSDCKGYADAAALNTMKLRIGEMVCARTTDGRVVRMKLIDYPDCYCAIFDAVVWELS